MTVLFRWLQINYRVVAESTIGEITCSVIPESAAGGYPWFDRLTTLSEVEGESRCNSVLLDTGSHPPKADSSGMTIIVFSELVEHYRYTYLLSQDCYNVFS